MQIPRLKRESLNDAVLKIIEEALLAGDLKPGSRIIEADLAQQAGISRGPVREAIRQLVGEGILVNYPSRGTYVTHWDAQTIAEAYSLRAALERLAIQEAIKHTTPEDIARLEEIVAEMEQCAQQKNAQALMRLDIRFHEQLYALSRHKLLQEVLAQLRRRLYCLMSLDRGYALHRDEAVAEHQRIVAALSSGDAALAGDVIAAHVLAVGAELVEQVRQFSEESE